MKKINTEKDTIIKLYEENLNDIIWTHKIHATLLDELNKNYKIYTIIKESIIGLSGFVSIVFLYYEKYTGAIITNAISTLSIILENIFKFNNYEQKIKNTQSNVNDLWYMKKELTNFKEYLKNDIVSWKDAKNKLEENLIQRKVIYSKLEPVSEKVINKASSKLHDRKDEEVNKEFFDESE